MFTESIWKYYSAFIKLLLDLKEELQYLLKTEWIFLFA